MQCCVKSLRSFETSGDYTELRGVTSQNTFNLQQRTMAGDSEVPVLPPAVGYLQTAVTTAERVRRHPSVPQTRYEPLAPGVSALSARCL